MGRSGVFFRCVKTGTCLGGELAVAVDCRSRIAVLQLADEALKGLFLRRGARVGGGEL